MGEDRESRMDLVGEQNQRARVNRLLRQLAAKAGIALGDKEMHFHLFRKLFLSSAIDSGVARAPHQNKRALEGLRTKKG